MTVIDIVKVSDVKRYIFSSKCSYKDNFANVVLIDMVRNFKTTCTSLYRLDECLNTLTATCHMFRSGRHGSIFIIKSI